MKLHNLKPAQGATKKRKRIGRGVGSGYGGHSSTRGNKGQNSISGGGVPVWFEGGQMPITRRLPKFGFKNPFRIEYSAVNVGRLQELVNEGILDPATPVTPEVLKSISVVSKGSLVKVLGGGEITTPLTISAHAFSASAKSSIELVGGTATVLA